MAASVLLVAAVVALAGCGSSTPQPVGDPDPGERLLAAIKPVLSVAPAGAHISSRDAAKPRWDSCDGIESTYGWDEPTVDLEFTGGGTDAQVVAHLKSALRKLGWTFDTANSAPTGPWYWHKTVASNVQGTVQLLGGSAFTPSDWDLQATTPPATHPATGC
ncbi:hypothetical protein ACFV5G_22180 [Streptomyces sp. NPDC059766]|uniref:hypothetical protein n=1 Tax=Streptomyces sp. NPDC059766 TaxID=3346940 RepID=UPI00364C5C58